MNKRQVSLEVLMVRNANLEPSTKNNHCNDSIENYDECIACTFTKNGPLLGVSIFRKVMIILCEIRSMLMFLHDFCKGSIIYGEKLNEIIF